MLLSSRRGATLAVFLPQALPPPRASTCENRRDHLHSRRFGDDLPLTLTQQKAEGKGCPWIAVTHHRFYDLTRRKATPISMPAKGRSINEIALEKAWLTFSGYQSLIEFTA